MIDAIIIAQTYKTYRFSRIYSIILDTVCQAVHKSNVNTLLDVKSMKISTKGRYALRLLVDLAEHSDEGFIALKDIAKRQDISKKYLEQIVAVLNKPGILKTNRGYQGGYRLAKNPDQYTVGDILRITEGGLAPVSCLELDENLCERSSCCATLFIWEGLYKTVNDYLDSITLKDVLAHKKEITNFDYVI